MLAAWEITVARAAPLAATVATAAAVPAPLRRFLRVMSAMGGSFL